MIHHGPDLKYTLSFFALRTMVEGQRRTALPPFAPNLQALIGYDVDLG